MTYNKEVKCKHCGAWNEVSNEQDICISCNKPLNEVSTSEKESIERRLSSWQLDVPILETDNWFIKLFKGVFNRVQMVFLAILSFFLWLIAAGPG